MDLKTHQVLAQQLEQIVDLLLQEATDRRDSELTDHSERIRFRHDVMRALVELKAALADLKAVRRASVSEDSDHVTISKSHLSMAWSVAKTVGPWLLTGGVTLFHLLSHLKGI